jgi:hypothetical protein
MALKFQGGKINPVDLGPMSKLEILRNQLVDVSDELLKAQMTARSIGGLNRWTERVTAMLRECDAMRKDLRDILAR